jgi:hypothetical protein
VRLHRDDGTEGRALDWQLPLWGNFYPAFLRSLSLCLSPNGALGLTCAAVVAVKSETTITMRKPHTSATMRDASVRARRSAAIDTWVRPARAGVKT